VALPWHNNDNDINTTTMLASSNLFLRVHSSLGSSPDVSGAPAVRQLLRLAGRPSRLGASAHQYVLFSLIFPF